MVIRHRLALRARVDAATPFGLLQWRTRYATSARLYRDLPRPLGLAHTAAATARAPRTPFADLAISGCTWNHECNYSARKVQGFTFNLAKRGKILGLDTTVIFAIGGRNESREILATCSFESRFDIALSRSLKILFCGSIAYSRQFS